MLCCQKSKFFQRCSWRCVLYIDFSWSVAAHFAVSSIAFDVSAPLGCWLLCFVFSIHDILVVRLCLNYNWNGLTKKSLFWIWYLRGILHCPCWSQSLSEIANMDVILQIVSSAVFKFLSLFASVRRDVRVRRIYIGSMEINDQRFLPAYEDPSSSEFTELAALVSQQVSVQSPRFLFFCLVFFLATRDQCLTFSVLQLKLLYSRNSVSSKYFTGSTVQAFRYESHDMACIACKGGLCQDVCPCCKI